MIAQTSNAHSRQPWSVLRGAATPAELRALLAEIAAAHDLRLSAGDRQTAVLEARDGAAGQVTIRWQPYRPDSQRTQGHVHGTRPGPGGTD